MTYRGTPGVSLWDMLTFACAGTALAGAYVAAEGSRAGRLAVGLATGLVVSVGSVWFIRSVGAAVGRSLSRDLQRRSDRISLYVLYTATVGWLILSGVIGFQVATVVLRMF